MNIKEFFQHRAGIWNSQRTSHHLIIKKSESGQSSIEVTFLEANDPEVAALCEEQGFNADRAFCGAKVTWNGSMDWDKKEGEHQGSTVLVAIQESENTGILLRQQGYAEKAPVVGRYTMSAEGVLSLITEYGTVFSEEKLWFPRPNLCMRAGLTIGLSNVASFCTEMRKAIT
jgi:CpeS-like protein